MIELNLANPEESWVKFQISPFPDGQQTLTLQDFSVLRRHPLEDVLIKTRLSSFRDVEVLICAVQALRGVDRERKIHLYVPYFLGSRSDRKFVEGGVNYLRDVICPIINSMDFSSVTVLDPHSDVLEACLKNYVKIDNSDLMRFAMRFLERRGREICLVSPDAGAYKKIFGLAREFGVSRIATATKVRDLQTGVILSTEVPNLPSGDIDFVIVDDICDGGRTFIELARVIREMRPDADIFLVVTHGIFSQGLEELSGLLSGIYTTDSYRRIEDGPIDNPGSRHRTIHGLLKQKEVF